MVMSHTHKLKFKRQSAQTIEWKQTEGRTEGRTLPIALPSGPKRSVKSTKPLDVVLRCAL